MRKDWMGVARLATALTISSLLAVQTASAQDAKPIIHDAEYYILDAKHGEQWKVEDKELDQKLAELRQKFGTPPNIIHVMWDATPVGEVGIPALQKVRGLETPNINRLAAKASISCGCTRSRPARRAARPC
jgi:hypothetical protein